MLHSHEHIIIYSVQVQHQVVRYPIAVPDGSARHFLQVYASFGDWETMITNNGWISAKQTETEK